MTTSVVSLREEAHSSKAKRLYGAVWRWHFYAGLFSVPIILLLAVTGTIYLFQAPVETRLYRDMQQVVPDQAVQKQAVSTQLIAAQAAFVGERVVAVTPSQTPSAATKIELRGDEGRRYVYVNPYTAEVTGSQLHDTMLMQRIRKLHGELLLQRFGTTIVELVACWAIVLLITGLFLWWPRPNFRLGGVLYVRLGQGQRAFWRDIHSVTGFYISMLALVLLMSGLPWTGVWGGIFSKVRDATDQKTAPISFNVTLPSQSASGAAILSVDEIDQIAQQKGFVNPYTISLPKREGFVYGVYDRVPNNPSASQAYYLSPYTGEVEKAVLWDNTPILAKMVTMGIYLHQGELFGVLNIVLAMVAALGMALLSISGVMAWWKRRPAHSGRLHAPPMPRDKAIPRGITVITVVMGVFLPLLGASLVVVWVLERLVLIRVRPIRDFLGLPAPT